MNISSSNFDSQYDPQGLARFFDDYGLREWERLVSNPVDEVSLYIHTHYLQKFISPGSRVLEIGAGAGRFTQVLAQLGAQVLVADISPGQLKLNQQHAVQYGFNHVVESWLEVDICEMSILENESFDCVVAYGGPLSYVLERRDQALEACLRVLKPGGLILFSVMTLFGSAHRAFGQISSLAPQTNRAIIATGDISPATFPERKDSFMHLFRADELRQWVEEAGLDILAMSASGCLVTCWEGALGEIRQDPARWELVLEVELEASAEPGALDMGTHLICVAHKQIDNCIST